MDLFLACVIKDAGQKGRLKARRLVAVFSGPAFLMTQVRKREESAK